MAILLRKNLFWSFAIKKKNPKQNKKNTNNKKTKKPQKKPEQNTQTKHWKA